MSKEERPQNTGGARADGKKGDRGKARGGRGRGRGRGGRGRGRSPIPTNNNNNHNHNDTSTNNRNRKINHDDGGGAGGGSNGYSFDKKKKNVKQPLVPNTKKNGEKGADAHTVDESLRIRFGNILQQFREDDTVEKFEFPPNLTNTERKFLHELSSQMGVKSKSTGKGDNRRIVVSKLAETKKKITMGGETLPLLRIGPDGEIALKRHLSKYPPIQTERSETGSYHSSNYVIASTRSNRTSEKPRRHNTTPVVDIMNRRRARHADFQHVKHHKRKNEYQEVLQNRSKLPAYKRQAEIVATVGANSVTIIEGETGCGKSTQCPQFLLDANPTANIAVTQPRRISAISIAERVAQEQCLTSCPSSSSSQKQRGHEEKSGIGSLVGYQVRLESESSKDTQLLFLTPGILLRKLQSSPMLAEYTHIIIDEVHERDKYTEFLLIRLRDLLPLRPDLRLVLMSATLQTEVLMKYFAPSPDVKNSEFYRTHPPVMLSIEGRTFPVQEYFLEHVLELTQYIEVDDFDDDDVDFAEKRPMSMDKLEEALADISTTEVTATKCALCGITFARPCELAEHMSHCSGLMGDLVDLTNFDADNNLLGDGDFKDYDDYDENASQEAADYILEEFSDYPSKDETNETNVEKWDGEGLFDANVDKGVKLSSKQEKYLNLYSTMYNDEEINTCLLLEILHYILKTSSDEGAILVFLPGWQEISEVNMLLESTIPFSNKSAFLVLPLHSGIPSHDQRRVLRRPPRGVRKIILSTNIAETSLTIDDVTFVVDAGRAKEKSYDPHLKTSTLQPVWVSRSSATQRKGRAGRTRSGVCFHLFSSRRFEAMRPFVESELLRTPLEEMAMMTKNLGLAPGGPHDSDGIPAFLMKAMTPPHAKSIDNALELLVELGAMLPVTNDLTTLGDCLSVLSLEPRVGKMVIWSYLLGCTRVASQFAVAMSYKTPFVLPPPRMRREAESSQLALSNYSESDQVTVLNAIIQRDKLKKKSEGAYREWCRRNFLNPASLQMIGDLRKNVSRELSSLGFADPMINGYQNRHDKQHALWEAAIAAGLYPNVATRRQGDVNFSTMTNRKAKIHVSSVNSLKSQRCNSKCQIEKNSVEFLCFGEILKGSHFFTLLQTTHLPSPLPLLLLCGNCLSICADDEQQSYSVLNLDDWIIFKCTTEVAFSLVILRCRLERAFWKCISQPKSSPNTLLNAIEQNALETLAVVLESALKCAVVR